MSLRGDRGRGQGDNCGEGKKIFSTSGAHHYEGSFRKVLDRREEVA